MREELIALTKKELERLAVVRRVMQHELKQKVAAELLALSTRQVRNLVQKVERDGARGLAHGNRGKSSPKRMSQGLVDRIVALVKEHYRGFKPKFAAEKLWKRDKIKVSDEKMRRIMIEAKLWHVRRHQTELHPWREPKAHYGEMVQMDGSHHAWLERRGPKLVLMGMVDDARNRFYGRFYAYEGVYPAMNVLERAISGALGSPRAYTSINTAPIRRSATPRRMSCCGEKRPRPSSSGPHRNWGSSSSMPTRRRPRGGSSGPSPHSRTGWSKSCGWPQSRLGKMRTASWRLIFLGSTPSSSMSRASRRIFIDRCPRRLSSKRPSISRRSVRSSTDISSAGRGSVSPSRS